MKKILLVFGFILSGAFSTQAQASIVVDPFLAYESGSNDVTGVGFGARIGYGILGFSAGIEYGSTSFSGNGTSGTATDLGAYVGYEFPILLRAYLSYFLDSKMDSSGSEFTGNGGYKMGVGYTGLPLISINLETIQRKYSKMDGAEATIDVDPVTAISVSYPISF